MASSGPSWPVSSRSAGTSHHRARRPGGSVPDEWVVPQKGLYFRASITEQLPDPLSTLFADLMATAVPEGLRRMLREFAPETDFG